MRPARRNRLLALSLLLLTAQAGPKPLPPDSPLERAQGAEDATRRRVEDSERVRSVQIDAQREATEQLARVMAEEKRLTAAQAEAFERLKAAEAAVNEITLRGLDLDRRRAEARARFEQRAAALRPILPVIIHMSTYPVEALLAAQVPPEDAVRGIVVLRFLARQANSDARALIADREALDAATREVAEIAPRLAAAEAARSFEADALARQLAAAREQRQSSEQEAADAARRAAAEAARAKTLRSMLQILETQRRLEEERAREDVLRAAREQKEMAAEAARLRQAAVSRPTGSGTLTANTKPAGQLTRPVEGVLLRGWGDPEDGELASGQTYLAPPGARVVAPCGGTVAFAEPFGTYGLMVIIDCGGGYHAVVSGMERLSVAPGRTIRDGDSIGTMRTTVRSAQAADAATGGPPGGGAGKEQAGGSKAGGTAGASSRPELYFEVRRDGRPTNPAPWLKPAG